MTDVERTLKELWNETEHMVQLMKDEGEDAANSYSEKFNPRELGVIKTMLLMVGVGVPKETILEQIERCQNED